MLFNSWGSPTCRGYGVRAPARGLFSMDGVRGTGLHLGACAMGFNVLKGLWCWSSWQVQGANELLLGFSRREGHACRVGGILGLRAPSTPSVAAWCHPAMPTLFLGAICVGASIQNSGIYPPGQGLLGQQNGHHSLRPAVSIPWIRVHLSGLTLSGGQPTQEHGRWVGCPVQHCKDAACSGEGVPDGAAAGRQWGGSLAQASCCPHLSDRRTCTCRPG